MEFNSIKQTAESIKNKKISIKELNEFFIKKIKKNLDLNTYIYFDENNINEQLKTHQNIDNILNGIPLAIKDLFCTKFMPTTAASRILKDFQPTYESFVTQKLLNDGCIFLGKTNCDEFAMGSANTTSFFGNVINPLSKKINYWFQEVHLEVPQLQQPQIYALVQHALIQGVQ